MGDADRAVGGRFEIPASCDEPGEAVRAVDRESGDVVALRLLGRLSAGERERLEQVATALTAIEHPRVVSCVAYGTAESGEQYCAEAWVEGPELRQRVRGTSGLGVAQSVVVVRQAAEALAALHAEGIVHRNVRPCALLLEGGDLAEVRLARFGVAPATVGKPWVDPRLDVPVVPAYMAPEQATGVDEVDPSVDVFALGCVLYECLTGQPAFVGSCPVSVLLKLRLQDASRVCDARPDLVVPAALEALLGRMVSKKPGERPADGSAVVAALAEIELGGTSPVSTSSSVRALTEREQRLISIIVVAPPSATGTSSLLPSGPPSVSGLGVPPVPGSIPGIEIPPSDSSPGSLPAPGSLPTPGSLPPPGMLAPPSSATSTPPPTSGPSVFESLCQAAQPYEAEVEQLVDGSVVAVMSSAGLPTEQATRAASCALAMRAARLGTPMVLHTGRQTLSGRTGEGGVFDRVGDRLETASADGVHIDEITAGLLAPRFDVRSDGQQLTLRAERAIVGGVRRLLGRPTNCVGRDEELSQLIALYDRCVAQPCAQVVLVTGPPGMGKSRLRFEFVRRVRQRGQAPELLFGTADPLSGASAYGLLGPALRSWIGLDATEAVEVQRHKLRTRIGRHLAVTDRQWVTEFIGELAGVPFAQEDSVQLRAARRDSRIMVDQTRDALGAWLTAECQQGPVLIVLENLQWGDLPTIQLVDAALGTLVDAPIMVVGVARPEVHERFEALWLERRPTELELEGLSAEASEQLVRQVLGHVLGANAIKRLVDRAQGNPFYLEELIRTVAEGKERELPESVLGMVQARLVALDPEVRRVLRAASVFGETFREDDIVALTGGEQRAAPGRRWLDELVRRELINRHDDAYRFQQELVREAAYAMLTESDRVLAHRLAAAWLEQTGERDALSLAEHFQRGEQLDRALPYFTQAAQDALDGDDLDAALARAERGLACAPEGEALGELMFVQCEAHHWRSEHQRSVDCGIEAAQCLTPGGGQWFRVVERIVDMASKLGHEELCTEWIDRAQQTPAKGSEAARMRAHALCRAARTRLFAGDYDASDALMELAEQSAVEAGEEDAVLEARLNEERSIEGNFSGDLGTAVARGAAAVASYEKAGARRTACTAKANLGFTYLEIGAYEQAEALLRAALAGAQRMGLKVIEAVARHNLGLVLARLGDTAAGRVMETLAAEALRAVQSVRLEGAARLYLALIHIDGGDAVEGEREARRAIELLEGFPSAGGEANAALAKALLRLGRTEEAHEAAQKGMSILETLGQLEGGESLVRLMVAETHRGVGERDKARQAIIAARDNLLERGSKISDAKLRESFLQHVPENARTLELAAEWCDDDG